MPSSSRNSTWTHQIWVSYLFMILCKYIFHCFVSRLTKKTQFKIALANITPLHSHRENNNKANFSSQLKKKNLFCLFPWMQQSFSCCAQMLITEPWAPKKENFTQTLQIQFIFSTLKVYFVNLWWIFHLYLLFCWLIVIKLFLQLITFPFVRFSLWYYIPCKYSNFAKFIKYTWISNVDEKTW